MKRPEFVYMFRFEDDLWTYCYYDIKTAKNKAIEVARSFNPGCEIEGFYFDSDGDNEHLFYNETEDDREIVIIHSYRVEDYDDET